MQNQNQALLLIDIQNDYFEGGRFPLVNTLSALSNAQKALSLFRASGLPVIHVQHVNTREGATFFLPDTDGSRIHEALIPREGEFVVVKHAPSSFYQTNLADIINRNKITSLVVCGMMSHMCIDTTVRTAKDYSLAITLLQDACATRDLVWNGETIPAQTVHNTFMAALNGTFANVIRTGEFTI
jgi:nicotinamidase-related amidase